MGSLAAGADSDSEQAACDDLGFRPYSPIQTCIRAIPAAPSRLSSSRYDLSLVALLASVCVCVCVRQESVCVSGSVSNRRGGCGGQVHALVQVLTGSHAATWSWGSHRVTTAAMLSNCGIKRSQRVVCSVDSSVVKNE